MKLIEVIKEFFSSRLEWWKAGFRTNRLVHQLGHVGTGYIIADYIGDIFTALTGLAVAVIFVVLHESVYDGLKWKDKIVFPWQWDQKNVTDAAQVIAGGILGVLMFPYSLAFAVFVAVAFIIFAKRMK